MGGSAFKEVLPHAVFPRMPPSVYQTLKARLIPYLLELYARVTAPPEAPEKADHGDLDLVAYGPRAGLAHEQVRSALGATHSIPSDGPRGISNFAIPVTSADWGDMPLSEDGDMSFQVDVQVCADEEEWDRVVFFTSYGDMGTILGTLASSVKLSMGNGGLRLASPLPTSPPLTFRLSSSFPEILAFFGISLPRWEQGFATQREIFEWIIASRFFDAQRIPQLRFNSPATGRKRRFARPMYQAFLDFAGALPPSHFPTPADAAVDMALDYFGCRALHGIILHYAAAKKHARTIFTSRLAEEWTGLKGLRLRPVMEAVRKALGGTGLLYVDLPLGINSDIDPVHLRVTVWEMTMFDMTSDQVRRLVMESC